MVQTRATQQTFHEYAFPDDRSVHWHELADELREGATTSHLFGDVTCTGCRRWRKEEKRDLLLSELGATISPERYAPKPGELGTVRALGFNNVMRVGAGNEEEMFFIGPSGEYAENCNEEAAMEFIRYYEHHIETMKLYLLNGRNRKTHEWTIKVSAPKKTAVQP